MDDISGLYRMEVAGLILCGGRSLRMGRDKATLSLGGSTFIEVLAARMRASCEPLLVVGQSSQRERAPAGICFVADELDDAGPLAGIAAGLSAAANDAEFAQVAACDTPLHVPAVTQLLLNRIGTAAAAIPWDGTHVHGLNGLYRTAIAGQLRQFLQEGRRRVRELPDLLEVQLIPLDEIAAVDPGLVSFRGANTPEEYENLIDTWRKSVSAGSPEV
jgi:molybdenum cofactor guanylyltransferase